MKLYTPKQIRRVLKKYDLKQVEVQIGDGLCVKMVEIEDPYALLDRLLEKEERLHSVDRFPYWAEIWPSSLGLARWLYARASPPPRGGAVELGCGLGLVSVVLASMGWRIQATDFVEDALVLASYNAASNPNKKTGSHGVDYLDWRRPRGNPVDCLVASDVAYEVPNHRLLMRVLDKLLLPKGRFFLSDPQRPATRKLVAGLKNEGYDHHCEAWPVRWGALEHQVDIHTFVRPP